MSDLVILIIRLAIYFIGFYSTYHFTKKSSKEYTDQEVKKAEVTKQLFVMCPNCGHKIVLTNDIIQVEEKVDGK